MRLLLDTTYLYRLMATCGRFSDAQTKFFADNDAELYASVVSIWEMRLKHQSRHPSGERKSPFDPRDAIDVLEEQNISLLTLSANHVTRALKAPISHKDPFDELLLVQAQEEGLRLLTIDRALTGHPLTITV